ncbi:MAG: tetratricopeptide repeat protein [Blastocatellia bacterium]|nr:tetratricopeptide repeat protein [Blastocatellia bacterium]
MAQGKALVATVPASPFQEADHLFTFGEDTARDKQSLAVIERELGRDGANYQWMWRAARACYFVGDDAAKEEKLAWFEKGIEAGRRAIAREPNAVEGHFWLAVNYGGYSEEKGVFQALATVRKIRAEMETVLRLDERYQDGGAYLALGEMDRQLPRIVGGNLGRAITRLEQGLRIAPENLEMKLALAEAYREAGRREDARKQLQEITQRQARSNADRRVQEKAKQKLSKL